ncbi:MAG: hypothetical protein SF070_13935 [Gemmatimonadota bacterium]|nr:hypothetical protein [Gemmatimonadota bacterium]
MKFLHMVTVVGMVAAAGCAEPAASGDGTPLAPTLRGDGSESAMEMVYGMEHGDREGCRSPGFRQFDFWLGDWSITGGDGNPAGASRITRDLGGCGVLEFYNGGSGRSISHFDRHTRLWHQDYVDATGFSLRLFGSFAQGEMRMQDSVRAIPNGPSLLSKFTWTPNPDGTVRQLWEFSLDGGASFFVNFNGLYTADPAYAPPAPPLATTCIALPAYRAADGLLGTWQVTTERGERLGTTTLTLTTGDCLIEEVFRGRDGFLLQSFLYYDRFVAAWRRVQVDNRANSLHLGGGFDGPDLQMTGLVSGPRGRTRALRLTWTPSGADRLVQRWEEQQPDGSWHHRAELQWARDS